MSIVARCPSCDAKFKVNEQYAGRRAKCPRCSQAMVIPSAAAKPPAAKPPAAAKPPTPAKPPAAARPATPASPAVSANPAPAPVAPTNPLPPVAAGSPPAPSPVPAGPAPSPAPAVPTPSVPSAALPGVPSRRAPRGRGRRRGKGQTPNVWILVGVAAVAALFVLGGGAFGVVWLFWSSSSPLASDAKLVLDWPAEDRTEAMLHINGEKRDFSGSGEVAYSLRPGDHRLVIRRRGYEPVEVSLSLDAGEVHKYAPQWRPMSFASVGGVALGGGATTDVDEPVPVGFEGWTQRYDAALRQAAAEKKDVLVALVGSDWNGATVQLARDVFPDAEFHEHAEESLVLVVVDLPQTQRAYEQILDSAQNAMLREEFNVSAEEVPTLVMLDSQGKPYAVENNYEGDSAGQLLADIEHWRTQRDERDRLFSLIEGAAGQERLDAAVSAVDWLREQGLTRFYGEQFRRWEPIAAKLDPANAAGQYEVLFEADWFARWHTAGRNEDLPVLQRVVKEFDEWQRKFTFRDPDRAARMNLVAAASMLRLDRPEDAGRYIEAGLKQGPKDEELLAQLQMLSQVFSGELGSGTGFVVAPGYVLTNYHVIEGSGRVVVMTSDSEKETPAEVIATDEENDMALLRVSGAADLTPLPLSAATVGRGARVAAFGYPLGDVLGRGLKLTTGVVSALPDSSGDNMYLLDCRVNPGNSGGPLCDQRGRVVGMVTAKSGISQDVDSYGMALPGDLLQSFLQRSIPGWTPPAVETSAEPMEWSEVDAAVSSSVLMVVKKR